MELSSKTKIRFIDCDPMGHLNNSKYIDYMLNAREDHLAEHYQYSQEEYAKKTGCAWVIIQNEIAYLKETRFNKDVIITSKLIELNPRTHKMEVLMKEPETDKIHAVLWATLIHFNLATRKSEDMPQDFFDLNQKDLVELEQKTFQERADFLRMQNK